MRCLVLLLAVAVSAGVVDAASSCAFVEQYFARHNVTSDDGDVPGPICGGQCCGRGREESMREALRRRVGARAAATVKPIADLLLSTRHSLQVHLIELSYQSQNKTSSLFARVYKGHAARTQSALSTLYDDIREVLSSSREGGDDTGSRPPKDLEETSRKFFRDVFPVAYHNVLKLDVKQFTSQYEACLRDAYEVVQPFADVPQQLGSSLSRSLEGARALLQVLALGASTLATSEQILLSAGDHHCSTLLLKAAGCSRCRGHDTRPCRNYCLNISRGCIGSVVSELDSSWTGYVEGVERMSRLDADAALRALYEKLSKAIMLALESHVILEKKVRQECGAPTFSESLSSYNQQDTYVSSRRTALRAPPPDTELLQFAASLAASKKLFSGVADRLCDEADFADDGNENCWNGDSIGEYAKPLVASSTSSDQKYNPELVGVSPQDTRVTALGDRLEQAKQVLMSHIWVEEGTTAESFMQGDEAGEEGSGSGKSYDDEGTYDSEGSGEGSGAPKIEDDNMEGQDMVNRMPAVPKVSAAISLRPWHLIFSLTSAFALQCLLT